MWSLPLTTDASTPTPASPELPPLGSHSPQNLQGQLKPLSLLGPQDTPAPIISFHLSRFRVPVVSTTLLAPCPSVTTLYVVIWPLCCLLFKLNVFSFFLNKTITGTTGLMIMIRILVGEGQQRKQWQPTPVLLPGKSHGRRSLVGCSPCGR